MKQLLSRHSIVASSAFRRWPITVLVPVLLWCISLRARAQYNMVYDDRVRTVCLRVGEATGGLPVLRTGGKDVLDVSFDELSHDYRRFTYRIEHVGADFEPESGLFESDYVQAVADEEVITQAEPSMNTSVLYTHYSFSLPNAHVRPLLSGCYRLTVSVEDDDGDLRPAWQAFFYVSEEQVGIFVEATTDTEVDRNDMHQQLSLEVNHSRLNVRAPAEELHVKVLQNERWDNAINRPRPTGQTVSSLLWRHSRELIFSAGNEYRKFEIPSTRYPGLHIDRIGYYAPFYHAALMTDAPRRNYLYDEDQNGRFVPIADFGASPDTEADYVWVHFALDADELLRKADVYLNGQWTYDRFVPDYRMDYNEESGLFEKTLLLKQGYYSYQYLLREGARTAESQPIEGNYWQTENEYTVLVFYRPAGSRYDRLVGHRRASYRPR